MPRICKVCSHPQRDEIERAILQGQSCREIFALFGVSPDSVQRHKTEHLPNKLLKAHAVKETLSADSLLGEMSTLRETLWRGLAEAEKSGSGAGIAGFARELRSTLESYFDLSERLAARTGGNNGPQLAVTFERLDLPDTCPHCGEKLS